MYIFVDDVLFEYGSGFSCCVRGKKFKSSLVNWTDFSRQLVLALRAAFAKETAPSIQAHHMYREFCTFVQDDVIVVPTLVVQIQ